jgi:hypothetical protein
MRVIFGRFRESGLIQRAAELALPPEYWGQAGISSQRSSTPLAERDELCNLLLRISSEFPDISFDGAAVTIGLHRLWDGRRDIVQLVPVQLVGMQAEWLNGAQGMVEGFKDPSTQVLPLTHCCHSLRSLIPSIQRFTLRIERPDDVVTRTGGTAKVVRERLVQANPMGHECKLIEEILVSLKALEASGRPNITRFLQVRCSPCSVPGELDVSHSSHRTTVK